MARFLGLAAAAAAMLAGVEAVIRISCVGDSITAGVCSKTTHGYPAIMQGILGNSYVVGNYGNSGKTQLIDGLCGPPASGNCSYWGTPTYPLALNSTPDIVTIALGTNDAKNFNWFGVQSQGDSYVKDYLRMIGIFKALPSKPRVMVIIPPPLYPPFPYDMNNSVINDIYPTLLPQIATTGGAILPAVDVFDAMGGKNLTDPQWFCDGCHPVDAGYQVFAQTLAAAIEQLVASDPELAAKAAVPAAPGEPLYIDATTGVTRDADGVLRPSHA